ncbi:TetR/AcrR family transcriptional regulator [Alkalihalobacillus sp. TS-13]|uniref:TetR/AcrR family transcriptional regulator n=1 Tax=Alkalihalobacillus sp. TS-13 TaxID=2842455 RepID=UPI001C8671D7|nr:TetR/AcrR family transcriptional regulator [Alkalihalobacillus sp. TS-13]
MGKQEVIDAAINQYSLNGYQGATLQKIAKELGIKPASIYFYYKNKECLFIDAFQQLLDNHFTEMKKIMKEVENCHIKVIFTSLIDGSIAYHRASPRETKAYISLVTAPIPEIQMYLQNNMLSFNEWLVDALYSNLNRDYPHISEEEMDKIIKKFILIANGVFWSFNVYKEENFFIQLELGKEMIENIINQIPD